jgi:hypothetical protein
MDIKQFFSIKNSKNNSIYCSSEEGDLDITITNKNNKSVIYRKTDKQIEEEALKKVSRLPEVLVDYIKEYIPQKVVLFLDKSLYISHHYLVGQMLLQNKHTEKYIRYIIRRDFSYVFGQLLNENIDKWLRYKKKYPYNNLIYTQYIYFLIDYCIEHESVRCKEEVTSLLQKLGLCKKDNKKIKVTSIKRWRS